MSNKTAKIEIAMLVAVVVAVAVSANGFFQSMEQLTYMLPTGWNGVIVPDGDGDVRRDIRQEGSV